MDNQLQFCTVDEAVEEIRQGRMIIVTDDPGRENEADLIIAAEFATTEAINFMVTHARGLVCAPLSPERADALQLPLMTSVNRENMSTAFTVSVDAAHDITTGISAAERALTIRTLADPKATVNDFVQPGHTFPLRAVPGGVLRRAGHTEATIDLVRMAALQPAGVCCEIMKEDGTMARTGDLGGFQKKHGLKACTVAQLIEYRRAKEKQIRLVETVKMPTDYGDFICHLYESHLDGALHLALVHGEISPDKPTLVRVHSECLTGDVFGSRPVRLRQPAPHRHAPHCAGRRRAPLPAPGRPRHRPGGKTQGLQAPGTGAGHCGSQPQARLPGRPSRLRHRRPDSA